MIFLDYFNQVLKKFGTGSNEFWPDFGVFFTSMSDFFPIFNCLTNENSEKLPQTGDSTLFNADLKPHYTGDPLYIICIFD